MSLHEVIASVGPARGFALRPRSANPVHVCAQSSSGQDSYVICFTHLTETITKQSFMNTKSFCDDCVFTAIPDNMRFIVKFLHSTRFWHLGGQISSWNACHCHGLLRWLQESAGTCLSLVSIPIYRCSKGQHTGKSGSWRNPRTDAHAVARIQAGRGVVQATKAHPASSC